MAVTTVVVAVVAARSPTTPHWLSHPDQRKTLSSAQQEPHQAVQRLLSEMRQVVKAELHHLVHSLQQAAVAAELVALPRQPMRDSPDIPAVVAAAMAQPVVRVLLAPTAVTALNSGAIQPAVAEAAQVARRAPTVRIDWEEMAEQVLVTTSPEPPSTTAEAAQVAARATTHKLKHGVEHLAQAVVRLPVVRLQPTPAAAVVAAALWAGVATAEQVVLALSSSRGQETPFPPLLQQFQQLAVPHNAHKH